MKFVYSPSMIVFLSLLAPAFVDSLTFVCEGEQNFKEEDVRSTVNKYLSKDRQSARVGDYYRINIHTKSIKSDVYQYIAELKIGSDFLVVVSKKDMEREAVCDRVQ